MTTVRVVCTTFHHFIDLKTTAVGKQLMVCVHVTSSAKGHSMPSLLEKPTSIRSAYLYHTHMHMALWLYVCIHVAACLQLCLPPQASSPLAHSNRMSQRMYASVPRCMPIARFGLIYNTMPSHIRKPFSKSLVNVWVCGMYVSVIKGRLKACFCLHDMYVYACVSVFVCQRTHMQ